MRLAKPATLDAVALFGSAKVVPGWQWIAERDEPLPGTGAPREALWWQEALTGLHRHLRSRALTPGPVIARQVVYNEQLGDVTLYVETWGRAQPGPRWGLPDALLTTLDGLARCPAGGDLLAIPDGVTGRT